MQTIKSDNEGNNNFREQKSSGAVSEHSVRRAGSPSDGLRRITRCLRLGEARYAIPLYKRPAARRNVCFACGEYGQVI
jgi:hypothetical protein